MEQVFLNMTNEESRVQVEEGYNAVDGQGPTTMRDKKNLSFGHTHTRVFFLCENFVLGN